MGIWTKRSSSLYKYKLANSLWKMIWHYLVKLTQQLYFLKKHLSKILKFMRCCCCCSVTQSCLTFVTLWTAAHQASLSFTISLRLLKLMSIESMIPSNHLILCRSLLLPSIFPSIKVFYNESALHIRWPKYGSFSLSINPSNEYTGLISFRIVWSDLFAVQGTLKNLFQHHSSKASIL